MPLILLLFRRNSPYAAITPCSRGEVEPHDFCSGGETIYEMRLHSAMMLSGGGYARRCIMAVAVQQIHPIAHLPLVLGVGYPLKAGQLEYDCHYSKMHDMPFTGRRGFRALKPL